MLFYLIHSYIPHCKLINCPCSFHIVFCSLGSAFLSTLALEIWQIDPVGADPIEFFQTYIKMDYLPY